MWLKEEKAKEKRCGWSRPRFRCDTSECMGWVEHPNKSGVGTCPSLRGLNMETIADFVRRLGKPEL